MAGEHMTQREVVLVPMQQSDLPTLQVWFEDKELSRRLGGMLPLKPYFDYVQSEPDYFAWMALEGETPIGAAFMQIETDEPQAFAFLVNPELRSKGYGRLIIQRLMAQPEAASATGWKVGIEPNNIASRRCLASVGFTPESEVEDEEGFLQYVYSRDRTL